MWPDIAVPLEALQATGQRAGLLDRRALLSQVHSKAAAQRRVKKRAAKLHAPGSLLSSSRCTVAEAARQGIPLSLLSAATVAPATQRSYLSRLVALRRWLALPQLPTWTAAEWDHALVEFAEECVDVGVHRAVVVQTICALRWAQPRLPRPLRAAVPEAMAALDGWGKLEPGASRPPVPRMLAVLMAKWLSDRHHYMAAFLLLLLLETYMRPSEGFSLEAFQITAPIAGAAGTLACCSILIRASELGKPGKTGEFDTSVALDLPRHRVLEPALLAAKRFRQERQLLTTLDQQEFGRLFRLALSGLGLETLKLTPYCLRHGGASEDRASRSRTLGEVQKRGGWKSFRSLMQYEKHARLALLVNQIPLALRKTAPQAEQELRLVLPRAFTRR